MPLPTALFRRAHRTFALGACTLVVPTVLALSAIGFLRAHGAAAASGRGLPEGSGLVAATGTTEVCDGRSLCFEFTTASDGPIWVLIQNRATPGPGGTGRRGVLVARTPGFEDSHNLRAGSPAERRLLTALRDLAGREDTDARVRGNLERLCDLISSRQQPSPALGEWYLY